MINIIVILYIIILIEICLYRSQLHFSISYSYQYKNSSRNGTRISDNLIQKVLVAFNTTCTSIINWLFVLASMIMA